jgi:lipoprotein-anchoring transpeptidase ErfK/SrfK
MVDAMSVRPASYFLVVNRAKHELEVWYRGPSKWDFRHTETYSIAVGTEGHETPAGVYSIRDKKRAPEYHVPDAPWTKDLGWTPKDVFGPTDPRNPLAGSFMQLTDDPTGNVGIHGTWNVDSLGKDASHGCIRVAPEVAKSLHRRCPRGTVVHII